MFGIGNESGFAGGERPWTEVVVFKWLTKALPGLSQSHKYLLMQLYWRDSGKFLPLVEGVEYLADALGYQRETFRVLMTELVEAGCLVVESARIRGPGRPSGQYSISPALKEVRFDELSCVVPLWWKLAWQILDLDFDRTSKSRRVLKLKDSARLLLVYLVSQSDESGVIRSAEPSEICNALGLRHESFASNIKILVDKGFILSVVEGVTDSSIFGAFGATYFMNLKHPDYSLSGAFGYAWSVSQGSLEEPSFSESFRIQDMSRRLCATDSRDIHNNANHRDAIESDVLMLKRQFTWVPYQEMLQPIAHLFGCDDRLHEHRILQLKIEEYASSLLSWRLNRTDKDERVVRDWIRKDLSKIKSGNVEADILSRREYIREKEIYFLTVIIFDTSSHLADVCEQHIRNAEDVPLESMRYVIVSVENKNGRRTEIGVNGIYLQQDGAFLRGNKSIEVPSWSVVAPVRV